MGGSVERDDVPTDEEVAAALAAVRMLLRRRVNDPGRGGAGSRWARAGRAEAVAALPGPVSWAAAERPR